MAKLIPVSRSQHKDLRYSSAGRFANAGQLTVVPVLMAELAQLIPEYCLAFRQRGQQLQLIALTGVDDGNVYLGQQNKWLAGYIPAVFRAHPFKFAKQQTADQSLLCIYDDALSEQAGTPLFNPQGELADKVSQAVQFLKVCDHNTAATQRAVDALQSAGVLQPWPLTLRTARQPEGIRVTGLLSVDEKALNALPVKQLADLRATGALSLAYGQLLSTARQKQLQVRLNFQKQQTQAADGDDMPDIESLFGASDDTLEFD